MEKRKPPRIHFVRGLSSRRRRESVRATAAGGNERERSLTLRDHGMVFLPASVSREVDIRQGAVYKGRTVIPSLTNFREKGGSKHGRSHLLDRGRAHCRLACREGDERRGIWGADRHHPWDSWRHCRRLGIRFAATPRG